jgi:hypothetical protein
MTAQTTTPHHGKTMPGAPASVSLQRRIRAEYEEMPGLTLTVPQPHDDPPRSRVRNRAEHVWLVTFMHCDLGYFDDETCRLEPIENPFGPKVLPMCSE